MHLTDKFMNLICALCFQDTHKVDSEIFKNIQTILISSSNSIPEIQKKKFRLATTLVRLRLDYQSREFILDSVITTNHFDEFRDFITAISTQILSDDKLKVAFKQVEDRFHQIFISESIPDLEEFIKKYQTSAYITVDEINSAFNSLIAKIGQRVVKNKQNQSNTSVREINLVTDDYSRLLNQIENNYSGKNSISSGFSELDSKTNHGFEKNRLYIFAGSSGDGKSVLLINLLKNAVETNDKLTGPRRLIFYYSLENLIDESFLRLYCCVFDKDIQLTIKNWPNLKLTAMAEVKEWLNRYNSMIVMKYFPSASVAVSDLLSDMEVVKQQNPNTELALTLVDYLDLLMCGKVFDMHRLELGQITMDLKVAAVMTSIPWITVTQVNRSGYDTKDTSGLSSISESMKKIEHSDFIAMLKNVEDKKMEDVTSITNDVYGEFLITIAKNRSGPKNVTLKLRSRFNKFRIDSSQRDYGIPFSSSDEPLLGII